MLTFLKKTPPLALFVRPLLLYSTFLRIKWKKIIILIFVNLYSFFFLLYIISHGKFCFLYRIHMVL